MVTLSEARDCGLEIVTTVKDEGPIFSILWVSGEDSAEGSVDIIAWDGGFVDSHVRCHVENGSIKYEEIGEPRDLVPTVSGSQGGVSQTKGGGSLCVESAKLTICRDFAWVIDRGAEG